MAAAKRSFQFGEHSLVCDGAVHLMGIVNVTPDSFSDGGRFAAVDAAVARGLELAAAGAAVLDIGGESTRPWGHVVVDAAVEESRVVPVIAELSRQTTVPISIDTSKATVAAAALAAGAVIINDVTGFERDESAMLELVRKTRAGCVVMHSHELPGNGQAEGAVAAGLVEEYLAARVARLTALTGLGHAFFVVDPGIGIGFGKDWRQNLA
ncbi:MAG: dihydropteroate synthase, partial [Lentisphaeria bacterium]|nr:dihydropteroate synthase [Lentisphaeria bacterium]